MTDLDARTERGAPTLFSAPTWGPPVGPPPRRRSGFVAGLVVGALVAAGLGAAFLLGRSSGAEATSPLTVPAPAATVVEQPATTLSPPPEAATSEAATPEASTPPAAGPAPTTVPAPVGSVPPALPPLPPADPAQPVQPRSALYAGGSVVLRGAVPTQAVAEALVAKVAAVVGPEQVVVEYVVDARAAVDQRVPLQVVDTVLFEPGASVVAPDFLPLLDLGAALLTQNPAVTMTIIGHTDSQGTPEANLVLSKQRVDAVVAELVVRGVNPAQLVAVPRGADAPVADNGTDEGRRVNRRVEFQVAGLLEA